MWICSALPPDLSVMQAGLTCLATSFVEAFLEDYPGSIRKTTGFEDGKTHRDFTEYGKARFHRYIRDNALREDLYGVVGVLKALRHYLGLPLI